MIDHIIKLAERGSINDLKAYITENTGARAAATKVLTVFSNAPHTSRLSVKTQLKVISTIQAALRKGD